MKSATKSTGLGSGLAIQLAKSLFISIAVTLLLAGIFACLINAEKFGEEAIGYGGMGILFAASAAGCVDAVRKTDGGRFLTGLLCGGLYFITLIGITALFFDGGYHGVLVNALMILCGSMVAVLLVNSSGKRGKGRAHYRRSGKVVQKRRIRK